MRKRDPAAHRHFLTEPNGSITLGQILGWRQPTKTEYSEEADAEIVEHG
jgi:hypothetical protein